MAVIALLSGKGSPGVSTAALALALAWPLRSDAGADAAHRVLVVEADAAGASSWPGFLRGQLDPDSGLSSLLAADPDDMGPLLPRAVIEIDGEHGRFLLPGLGSPQEALAHRESWPALARWLRATSGSGQRTDVLLDFGRVGTFGEPAALLSAADATVVVCRTDLPSVIGAAHATDYLAEAQRGDAGSLACLLVGEGQPYSQAEVEASLEVPVVGALGWDPASAGVLSHGAGAGRGFRAGKLMRSAVPVARALSAWAARDAVGAGEVSGRG